MTTREQWLKQRATRLNATDLPILLRCVTWSSPYIIWREKTGRPTPPITETRAMQRGRELEPYIAANAQHLYDLEITLAAPYTLVTHDTDPIAAATPDGYTSNGDLVEIKTHGIDTYPTQAEDWRQGLPLHVEIQCRWQMYVTGVDTCHVLALVGGLGDVHRILHRDKEFEDGLKETAARWWDNYVATDTPPELTLNDRPPPPTKRKGITIPNAVVLRKLYVSARQREKEAAAMKNKIQARIRGEMAAGDATAMLDDHGTIHAKYDSRGHLRVNDA